MSVRFISDLHLFEASSMDWRPNYSDVYQFADNLITNWNKFTSKEDTVITVGDIGHFCPKTIEVLNELNGKKILVLGNHDITWGDNVYTCGVFAGVYPSFDWNNVHIEHIPENYAGNSTWFVHGHHHRYDMPGMYNALRAYAADTFRLNCATDLINNRPCTIQELLLNKEVMLDKLRGDGILQEG